VLKVCSSGASLARFSPTSSTLAQSWVFTAKDPHGTPTKRGTTKAVLFDRRSLGDHRFPENFATIAPIGV
jgi:hypothetical protein